MKNKLSPAAVLRHSFSAYIERAPLFLLAALMLVAVIRLDSSLFRAEAAVGAGLVNLLLFALFVCFVVLAARDLLEAGICRGVGELLRRSWSAVGRLLLVGFFVSLAITFVSALESGVLITIVIAPALGARASRCRSLRACC